MAELKNILYNFKHGLPGLGVNGNTGADGTSGASIYIGHLRDFFNKYSLTSTDRIYALIKNQDNDITYYKKDENFFKAIQDDIEKAMEFSVKNVHSLSSNIMKRDIYQGITSNNLENVVKQIRFLLENTNVERGRNGYGIPKIEENYFDKRTLSDMVGNTAANQKIKTQNIVYPTYLYDWLHKDDILYIIDDITETITAYIVLTEDMLHLNFTEFIKYPFVNIDSVVSSFQTIGNRVYTPNTVVIPDYHINNDILPYKINYIHNFVKNNIFEYPLNVITNVDSEWEPASLQVNDSSNDIAAEYKFKFSDDAVSINSGSKKMKLSNLYMKNISCTNINVPEYNTDKLLFSDKFHIDGINTRNVITDIDNNTITINVSESDIFTSYDENGFYGLIIYRNNSGKKVTKVIEKTNNYTGTLSFKLSDKILYDTNIPEDNNFSVIVFAGSSNKTTTYYSTITDINVEVDFNNKHIKSCTVKGANTSNIDVPSSNNNYVTFSGASLSANRMDNANLYIKSDYGKIKSIYINNQLFMKNNKIYESEINSWFTVTNNDIDITDDMSCVINFKDIEANIPRITKNDDTVFKFFNKLSEMQQMNKDPEYVTEDVFRYYQSNIPETEDREILVVVLSDYNGTTVKSSYKMIQPGIKDAFGDVSISLKPIIDGTKLEDSNKAENGILCNQIQFFTDMIIDNFNEKSWSKYFDDITMDVYLQGGNNTDTIINSTKYTTLNGSEKSVQIYSNAQRNTFKNNAIKVKLSYIDSSYNISYDSSIIAINNAEKSLKFDAVSNDDVIQKFSNWIPISSSDPSAFKYNLNDEFTNEAVSNNIEIKNNLTRYIQFNIDKRDDNCISGITFKDVNTGNIKLRAFAEVANPIPMEFNFNWGIRKIVINVRLKEIYRDKNENQYISFVKDKIYNPNFEINTSSGNVKLIINPIYMTAAPEAFENISDIVGSNIKRKGSEETIMLSTGLYDIDDITYRNYDKIYNSGTDVSVRYTMAKDNIPDIKYYKPKKKYFQDNIQNISITTRNIYDDASIVESDYIKLSDSSIFDMYSNKLLSTYNIKLFDPTSELGANYHDTYMMLAYNADMTMHPRLREGESTFYYNDKLYEAKRYNQYTGKNSLLAKEEITNEIINQDLYNARITWNYEYEESDNYVITSVHGGNLTKSGNGFLVAPDSLDIGQYTNDKILSLKETQSLYDEYAINDISVLITEPANYDVDAVPKKNEYYRSFLWDLDWVLPAFVNSTNNTEYYPLKFGNPFESYYNLKLIKDYYEKNDDKLQLTDFLDISDVSSLPDKESFVNNMISHTYITNKSIGNNTDIEIIKDDPTKYMVYVHFPYNLAYDIYPRTAYNMDSGGNVYNIIMLQQPSVVNKETYNLTKHYFNNGDELIDPSTGEAYENTNLVHLK